ncbi:hypothetical protein [Moraxella canis]|uniref:hypothetical protein n=1 Tax=Moraxella canis TaxID=90239 RepID=UPI000668400B|nr:hypothetical protein [Moraxella canis]
MFAIVTLRKNNNGTYFANTVLNGRDIKLYLSNQTIQRGWLISKVSENLKYIAFIQKGKGKDNDAAYINQILQIPHHIEKLSNLEFTGKCYLKDEGKILFKLQIQDISWLLPYSLIKDFIYKIFNNSLAKISFSLSEKRGFVVQNMTPIRPLIKSSILGYITSANKQKDKGCYSAIFYPDGCDDKSVFLRVGILDSLLNQNGIFEISKDAVLHVSLTFNHENNKPDLKLLQNPEHALHAYNTPRATLYFIEIRKTKNNFIKYIFKTQTVKGVSLLVSLWESDVIYYFDNLKNIVPDSKILCKLDFSEKKGWINYRIKQPKKDRYDGLFKCYRNMGDNGYNYLWFEYLDAPYFRFRISQESFFNHGIYNISIGASVKLTIERKNANSSRMWLIKDIDKNINSFPSDSPSQITAEVVSTWTKYDSNPSYITRIVRSMKNYALKHHCIAKVKLKDVELLVVIPKQLLVLKGFTKVRAGEKFDLEVFTIKYPLFSTVPIKFLCANIVKKQSSSGSDKPDNKILTVEFVQEIGLQVEDSQEETYIKYEFKIVDNNETIYFNDRRDVLTKIKNIRDYQYIIRFSAYNGDTYIRELISAKMKSRLK